MGVTNSAYLEGDPCLPFARERLLRHHLQDLAELREHGIQSLLELCSLCPRAAMMNLRTGTPIPAAQDAGGHECANSMISEAPKSQKCTLAVYIGFATKLWHTCDLDLLIEVVDVDGMIDRHDAGRMYAHGRTVGAQVIVLFLPAYVRLLLVRERCTIFSFLPGTCRSTPRDTARVLAGLRAPTAPLSAADAGHECPRMIDSRR